MRLELDHSPEPVVSPLTPWVHRALPGQYWAQTPRGQLTPPMPRAEPGTGFPVWRVSHRGRALYFASREEIAHAIDVLGQRVLPRPQDLADNGSFAGGHWLARLHTSWKPWKVRARLVETLKTGL